MLQIFYTILLYLIQPLICLRMWLRGRKAPEYRRRWSERYGFCAKKIKPNGIMLHSASVGETLAATPLIRSLLHCYPTLPITVTTTTPTGSKLVQSTFGNDVYHVYLPYDFPCAIKRFFNQVNPKLVIIMETELWPNLITELHRREISVVIANARLSGRSAAGYKKIGSLIRNILCRITLIAAQNHEDAERFIDLGLQRSHLAVTGSLKFDISVTPELAERAIILRRESASRRPVWIAASTHKGEETIILTAHRELLNRSPNLLLILVPRHPEYFLTTRALTHRLGFSYTLRSSGEVPSADTQVVIGDTMGELMMLYGIADIAFVGGSLLECGGHNPLEPSAHAIPILMGPHTFNFKDICLKLSKAGGLITVKDTDSIVKEVNKLLIDKDYRLHSGRHAIEVLHQNQGSLHRLLTLIEPYLLVCENSSII
ncbi:MAG: lipid IV(A) 3-deoxy-D-manno-octulosonic acid transferase [Candidatus Malihini olakiniferum]